MDSILGVSEWPALGVLIAAISLLFAIFHHKRKRLSYRIMIQQKLLSVDEEIENDIEVTFRGTNVRKLHLLLICIFNDGNQPLKPGDFLEPLKFFFGKHAKVIGSNVVAVKPRSLAPCVEPRDESISIEPLLLNPRDEITIKLLIAQFSGEVFPIARIVGVGGVREKKYLAVEVTARLVLIGFAIGAISSAGTILGTSFGFGPETSLFTSASVAWLAYLAIRLLAIKRELKSVALHLD